MQKYSYVAFDAKQQKQQGAVIAGSEQEAREMLKRQSLLVLSVALQKDKQPLMRKRVHANDTNILFLKQLSVLLKSGVKLGDAMATLVKSFHGHPEFAGKLHKVHRMLSSGSQLSHAFDEADLRFPKYVYYLCRAGELTGDLGGPLEDAATRMSYERKLNKDIRQALTYPIILIGSGILAVLIIFFAVVPKFTNLLDKSEDLPWLAWAVLSSGRFFNENTWFVALCALLLAMAGYYMMANRELRERIHQRLFSLPIVGEWLTEAELAKWSGLSSSLLDNNVPLVEALSLSAQSVTSDFMRARLLTVVTELKQGQSLFESVSRTALFDETLVNLVKVGEDSGELPKMLGNMADIYDERAKELMVKATTLIEPAAILIIGCFVGLIMVAIILAITSANSVTI